MSAATIIADIAKRARIAARTLAASSGVERNQLLLNIADELEICRYFFITSGSPAPY